MSATATTPTTSTGIAERWLSGTHGKTRYWAAEHADGVPLVLLHGYGGLIEHWQRLMPLLAEQHPVYALDLHNFGYSSVLTVTPSKDIWAAQVAHLIRAVVQQPAVIIGHSLGGAIAAQLAHNEPSLVRALVLVNSVGNPPDHAPSLVERALFGVLQVPGLGELLARTMTTTAGVRYNLELSYHDKSQITPEMVETFAGPLRRPNGPDAYLAVTRTFSSLPLDLDEGCITQPIMIVWGEQDHAMPATLATRLKERFFPDADIRYIPESGHCCFDERPAAFTEIVLPWIERHTL
ncbi:MAG: alpha/beta fold hydrolase [Chloroflexaceae bacterium]|nr:alpha/beta fold hydrolase [Chloroflexaceae bacterium]